MSAIQKGKKAMYNYNPFQWLLIFYIYCILGWLFESAVVSIQQRRLVNRGFLRGPMLPIYGFGATIMLHVSLPLLGHPVAIYFAGLVTATAFEYLVGVLMETLFKVRYWDYSAHRFQFQGRICLDSSIAWGFLSLLLAYVLHKPVAQLITGLPRTLSIPFAAVVTVLFLYDVTLSAKAAFEFAAVLEELEKLRAEAEGLRVQLNLGVREAQDRLDEARAQLRAAHSELESGLRGRIQSARSAEDARREQLRQRLAAAETRLDEHIRQRRRHYAALLHANPSARSTKFPDVLHLLHDRRDEP